MNSVKVYSIFFISSYGAHDILIQAKIFKRIRFNVIKLTVNVWKHELNEIN